MDGDDLSASLANHFGLAYSGESLQDTYAACVAAAGDAGVVAHLRTLFQRCKPSVQYFALSRFPWARIYTLNIDDALETALAQNSPQAVRVKGRNDAVTEYDATFSELSYIKLNGSIDRPDDGFVFSPQEYGVANASIPNWYQELGGDFNRFHFLFIGTKLREPVFHHAIQLRRRLGGESGPTSFVITPAATEIERKSLSQSKLEHIPCSLADFVHWLDEQFPVAPTLIDLAQARRPELRALIAQVKKAAQKELLRLLTYVDPVNRVTLGAIQSSGGQEGEIRSFYRGFKPTWRDILDGVPAEIQSTMAFQRLVADFVNNSRGTASAKRLLVCYGPAGSGKTTLIMQTALQLADQTDIWPAAGSVDTRLS